MREVDRLTVEQYATPSLLLMESAAAATLRAISDEFEGNLSGTKALILCGPGNNGGDGAALARQMADIGMHVDLVLLARVENTRADARTNFEAVKSLSTFAAGSQSQPSPITFIECDSLSEWEDVARPVHAYDMIVDALFGTGLTRPVEGIYAQVIEHVAMLSRARDRSDSVRPLIVSVDMPSGLNADSSQLIGSTIKADLTVTFTAPKLANVMAPACDYNGKLVIADIGSPTSLIEHTSGKTFVTERTDVQAWLQRTRYTRGSYKNSHGHVLIIAGSAGYTGAAALCGNAAMQSGAGLVTVATAASVRAEVAAHLMPEVITTALAETDRGAVSDAAIDAALRISEKATVIGIGPGLTSEDERTRDFVLNIVRQRKHPVVIDADGLNCLAPWPADLRGSEALPLVLTPHPGEMLRLIGGKDKTVLDDRVAAARGFAERHHVIVLLKGAPSLIAAPDGRVFINPTGNPGLGTAGSGDTLTGLVAGLIAQGRLASDPQAVLEDVIAGLYIGGLAGDLAAAKLGMRAMVASDIREHFSEAILSLDRTGELFGVR